MRARRLTIAFAAIAFPFVAHAIDPDEIMPNPALEARAREISSQLRCLVCQNESIDESEAPLAKDLRTIVRQRLAAGDTDAQVKSFLVARYGDFILLQPPFKPETLLLWFIPAICLAAGAAAAFRAARTMRGSPDEVAEPLSPAERSTLSAIVEGVSSTAESAQGSAEKIA